MYLLLIKNSAVDEAPEDSMAHGTPWVLGHHMYKILKFVVGVFFFTSRSPTDKNTKHAQMTYTCGHILRNNANSTNANQRKE